MKLVEEDGFPFELQGDQEAGFGTWKGSA